MIKILSISNKRRDIEIENIINDKLKENDIWDNQIINIQIRGNEQATMIYKAMRCDKMSELESYIKENPKESLGIGQTISDKWYVRPIDWAGIWEEKEFKLVSGNCLAYFDTPEELESKLSELKYFERRSGDR